MDSNFEVCGGEEEGEDAGEEYADDIEEEDDKEGAYWDEVEESESDESDPVLDRICVCGFLMSPKSFSVSFRPSSWLTPAKATTILSGRKKVFRYLFTTFLLMNCNRSWGQSRGFPRVLSL